MVEIEKWKQVYMTTNVPDNNGNYYYPALVPANAVVQLPITEIAPDPALGDRGLKFDWSTNTWNTSDEDPTNKRLAQMEQTINGLTANQLGMMADQVNSQQPVAPVQSSQPASASSASLASQVSEPASSAAQPTQPASSAVNPTSSASSQVSEPTSSTSPVSQANEAQPSSAKEDNK